jgi:hypothetical protein
MTIEEDADLVRQVTVDNPQFAAPKAVFDALERVLTAAVKKPKP